MTALNSPVAIVRDLFIDSLLFLRVVPRQRPLAVVDIGAGGGIPGLPMRLADPGLAVTLVEARRKRISFLLSVSREMGLTPDVRVIEGRAEEQVRLQPNLAESFDVAVSRAVGPIDRLLPVALLYLKPGGLLVVSAAPEAQAMPGVEVVHVEVPGSLGIRTFLTSRR
jgi:16S rRNA (guanine527-N7)-methyltransferase